MLEHPTSHFDVFVFSKSSAIFGAISQHNFSDLIENDIMPNVWFVVVEYF